MKCVELLVHRTDWPEAGARLSLRIDRTEPALGVFICWLGLVGVPAREGVESSVTSVRAGWGWGGSWPTMLKSGILERRKGLRVWNLNPEATLDNEVFESFRVALDMTGLRKLPA